MSMKSIEKIERTIRHVVALLVAGMYARLERESLGRLSAKMLEEAVSDHGRTLVMPPEAEFGKIDIIEISGASPARHSVRFDLWTDEEGRSDLTIELTLVDGQRELMDFELDNLHVL